MKIEVSKVKKVQITDIPATDSITVILENYGPGRGKIIIQSHSTAVSNCWGGMGDKTIEQFVATAPDDYLMDKLFSGKEFVEDFEGFQNIVKAKIIERRSDGDFSKDEAREYYDDVKDAIWESQNDLDVSAMQEILGDDWWFAIPETKSPEYEQLLKKVRIVKQALLELGEPLKAPEGYVFVEQGEKVKPGALGYEPYHKEWGKAGNSVGETFNEDGYVTGITHRGWRYANPI